MTITLKTGKKWKRQFSQLSHTNIEYPCSQHPLLKYSSAIRKEIAGKDTPLNLINGLSGKGFSVIEVDGKEKLVSN